MRKFFIMLFLLSYLFIPTQYSYMKNANALIIATQSNILEDGSVPFWISCLLLLPICAFDENYDGSGNSMSAEDLMANGYSSSQVDKILTDQETIYKQLEANNQKIVLEDHDNYETISKMLRTLNPNISDEYIQFFIEYNGI